MAAAGSGGAEESEDDDSDGDSGTDESEDESEDDGEGVGAWRVERRETWGEEHDEEVDPWRDKW